MYIYIYTYIKILNHSSHTILSFIVALSLCFAKFASCHILHLIIIFSFPVEKCRNCGWIPPTKQIAPPTKQIAPRLLSTSKSRRV